MAIVCGKEVTLPDPKNDEAVFNYIANHLMAMKHKSLIGVVCAYRSNGGTNACAAGCLVSDEEAMLLIEGHSVSNITSNGQLLASKGYNLEMVGYLQHIHDSHFPDRENMLKSYAIERGWIYDYDRN